MAPLGVVAGWTPTSRLLQARAAPMGYLDLISGGIWLPVGTARTGDHAGEDPAPCVACFSPGPLVLSALVCQLPGGAWSVAWRAQIVEMKEDGV